MITVEGVKAVIVELVVEVVVRVIVDIIVAVVVGGAGVDWVNDWGGTTS